ncbi:MAG: UDP-3-O-(3-hydroxymyristoyl)glucosamine N-acyltransferase [Paludibacteraceae bacterium]|nr:UDP-3-O-(3-hydroxymyristoyl)glucosamine N-acyltransferase [Paludibacteraceae bacterium]
MEFSAKQIAEYLGGEIFGDANVTVCTFAKIEEGVPGALSFLSNPKYVHYIYETKSSIVLVNKDFVPEQPISATLVKVDNAYESLAKLLTLYDSMKPKRKGIDPLAYVAPTAKIGKDVYLAPFSAVGDNAEVGDGTELHPHATVGPRAKVGKNCIMYTNANVYHDCRVGDNCILHSGSVVGADGFGFAPRPDGSYEKIPQIGIAVLEDDVEIGANTCVDRATMGATVVHKGVKLDNLIQIAHNVEVGENTVMASQVGVAGSTKIGRQCVIGGQVGFAGHIHVADGAQIGAQAGIISSLSEKDVETPIIGSPTMPVKQFMRSSAVFRKLPDMLRTINELQREVEQLKKQLNKNE